jgi:SNF2 family DNA or RNA helicase
MSLKITEFRNAGLLTAGRQNVGKAWADHDNGFWLALGKEATDTSKFMEQFRKHKVRESKALGKTVIKYFETRASLEMNQGKNEEKRLKKLAKDTADRVKKQWKAVEAILAAKFKMLVALDQKAVGKHHLHQIIEGSTKILKDQQMDLGGGDATSEESSEEEEEDLGMGLLMDDDMEIDEVDELGSGFKPVVESPQSPEIDGESQVDDELSRIEEEEDDEGSEEMEIVQKGEDGEEEEEDELSERADALVPPLIKHTLRDYQLHGVKWLLSLHNKGLNGILADEMVCVFQILSITGTG